MQLPSYNVVSTYTSTGAVSNFTYNFPANGTYSVQLRVLDPGCGFSNTYYGSLLNISNICNLNANFSSNSTPGGNVSFNNLTTGASGSLTAYSWSFGNGSTANTATASTNYTNSGVYTVTLTASNSGTCVSTFTANVLVCLPVASFTYAVGANGLVNFSSTSSGVNANTSYTWNYGNSQSSIGFTINNSSMTYTANGVYTVQLVIKDTITNCTHLNTQLVTVNTVTTPCNLNANFSVSTGTNKPD